VIVDESGLVVTNHHVIDGMTDVKVAISDKHEFPADIVLDDPRTDLAVLKLKAARISVMELGDSDAARGRDLVLASAIPSPSARPSPGHRVGAGAHPGRRERLSVLHPDRCAINPGNSGGALVDMNARLIGINSAIYCSPAAVSASASPFRSIW